MDKIWEIREYSEGVAQEIHQHTGVSMVMARLLAQRGVAGAEEAGHFLYDGLDCLTDPWLMQGMAQAVARINQAIDLQEKVIIYGDYDVDGVCSTVLLKDCLTRLGGLVDYYVPDRFNEGYGLNEEAIKTLAQKSFQLLITVDCGISSTAEAELAKNLGIDVIITDHHTPPPIPVNAVAVINPKNDTIKAITNLAGVGVAFKLACALGAGKLPEEEIYNWLDLVALATVADIVPLLDENRILVKYGLKTLETTRRPGLRELIRQTGLEGKAIQSWQVGFGLAPRLNSAGRLDSAQVSIELLESLDEPEAVSKATRLCKLNDERRLIEERIFQEAIAQIEKEIHLNEETILIIGGEAWHQGVIGIVASRLADQYNRPAIILSWDGDIGRGSARSVHGLDLYAALNHARDLLIQFGGHNMAAGLTISRDQLKNFKARIKQYIDENQLDLHKFKTYRVDMEIEEEDIKQELVNEMELLRPFGEGNPTPRFVLRGSLITKPAWVGNNRAHLKFLTGASNIEAIAFNRSDIKENSWQNCSHDLLFELDVNDFRGRRNLQIKIKDLKSSFIPDKLNWPDCNSGRLIQAIKRTVEELKDRRPVLFVYPAYRSLLKHQAVLEYYFHKHNVQPLHGYLSLEERLMTQKQITQGEGKVFLTTQSFLQYYNNTFDLPLALRYIIKMWPLPLPNQEPLEMGHREVETITQTDKMVFFPIKKNQVKGRAIVYANSERTVSNLNHDYTGINVEAGISDMRQRRAACRAFMKAVSGILLSDGTHTVARPYIGDIDELILADSPFGRYELTPFTDSMRMDQEIRMGIAFDQLSLERNRIYLNCIYPDSDSVQAVLNYCLRNRSNYSPEGLDKLKNGLEQHLQRKYSRLELRAAIRILADLGLCRFEKSGSIMPLNFMDAESICTNICQCPYYLEGLAEKQILGEWDMELNNSLVW